MPNARDLVLQLHPNPKSDDVIASTWQDCEPILDLNKQLADEQQTSDFRRMVARVPAVIIHQWLVEEWVKGNKHLRPFTREFNQTVVLPKLRDPNWKYLLVSRI